MSSLNINDPELPDTVLRQVRVRTLLLANNQLADIHGSITVLTDLRAIDLDHNRLQHIPECLFRITTLESIRACENQLAVVGRGISSLERLQALHLSHNPTLEFLPPALGTLPLLTTLQALECPMRGPPIEVMEQGAERALAYLNAMYRATAVGGVRGAPAPPTRELFLDGFDVHSNHRDLMDPQARPRAPRPTWACAATDLPRGKCEQSWCRGLDRALSPPLPLHDTPPRNTTPAPCSSRAPSSAIPGAPAGGRAQRRARLRGCAEGRCSRSGQTSWSSRSRTTGSTRSIRCSARRSGRSRSCT
jgi:hypothetical protein